MRLLCRQENDGVQSGDAFEVDTYGESPEDYLARKERSHDEKGWHVERTPDGALHAWKTYSKRTTKTAPYRKDRYFWVEA